MITIYEDGTAEWRGTIETGDGSAVAETDILALKITIAEKESKEIINSRNETDLYPSGVNTTVNGMKASVHATSGAAIVYMTSADGAIISGSEHGETHIIVVEFQANGPDSTTAIGKAYEEFYVKNIPTFVAP